LRAALALSLTPALPGLAGGLAEERAAAMEMARWALEEKRAEPLAAAISLLLAAGATDQADAPLSVHAELQALRALPGGAALARGVLEERARGVALGGGNSRIELVLNPGETHFETLVMAAREPALVEVRLYRVSVGADADLTVRDKDGGVLGRDTGPQTGIVGEMAFVEFTPETCLAVEIQISNAGDAPAHMVVLAPPALGQGCGG
jgi:hypothetical protein